MPLTFSSYSQDQRSIDVFTKGSAGSLWTATASARWIKLSASSGTITDEARVWVTIDWAAVPSGSSTGTVTVSAGGASKTVNISVSNPPTPSRSSGTGYVEGNGSVAIEAEHFTSKVDRGGAAWQVFTQLGRGAGDAVKAMPDLAPSVTTNLPSASPELDYNVYFFTTGSFHAEAVPGRRVGRCRPHRSRHWWTSALLYGATGELSPLKFAGALQPALGPLLR